MMLKRFAGTLAASACITAVAMTAAPSAAYAQSASYNIPAGSLRQALDAYARQSGRQVIYRSDDVRGARSRGARGAFSPEAALQAILSGSGFSSRTDPSGAVAIVRSGEVQAGGAAADSGSADAGAVADILVVGRRTLNVDIRRSENDPQPYVIFSGEDIARSGASSIDEFFRSRLPMSSTNRSATEANGPVGVTQGIAGNVDLRGLGTNQTLILVDGRRIASVGRTDLLQGNISGIPLAAIDRIEVLPSTAGAIYGGNAVGGVVNIVLKRDYTGLDIRVDYGDTFDFVTGDTAMSLTAGGTVAGAQINIVASRATRAPLRVYDRNELPLAARRLVLANRPDLVIPGSTPDGTLSNICSGTVSIFSTGVFQNCNGTDLILDNGTPLGSSVTFVPSGYPGPGSDGGAALISNAGQYNFDAPDGPLALMNGSQTSALGASVRRRFFNFADIFLDANWDRVVRESDIGLRLIGQLPADHPNNPFQQSIIVNYPVTGTYGRTRIEVENLRLTVGGIVNLPFGWTGLLEHGWSRTRNEFDTTTTLLLPGGNAFGAPFGTRDTTINPPDLSAYFNPNLGTFTGPITNTLSNTVIRLSGPVVRLPAGALTLTALLERREEQIDEYTQIVRRPTTSQYSVFPTRDRRVNSLYVEARVPLIAPDAGLPLIRSLDVQVSGRVDDYSTRSTNDRFVSSSLSTQHAAANYTTNRFSSDDYLVALRYVPFDSLTLRASYSTGFLPPGLNQIQSQVFETEAEFLEITDPRRGGEFVTGIIQETTFGNPDVQPERSESMSVGMIVEPRFLPRLRLSLDYTRIEKSGEITAPSYQEIINNETVFSGRVVRGPNFPGDPAGYAGPIVGLDVTLLNALRTVAEAFDLQVDYSWTTRFGDFHAYAIATRAENLTRQLLVDERAGNRVGLFDGPLEWRGNLGLEWTYGALSAGWNMQYYDRYAVYRSTDAPFFRDFAVTLQGATYIPSQMYHDLSVRYRFNNRNDFLDGLELTFGVQNIFNERPPVVAGFGLHGYSSYGDPRLRRFTVGLRKHFGG